MRFCRQGALLGNIANASLLDLYNNDVARGIRRDFVAGDYSSCNTKTCPRGISNLGTNRGDSPTDCGAELATLETLDIFRSVRAKDQAAHRRPAESDAGNAVSEASHDDPALTTHDRCSPRSASPPGQAHRPVSP